MRFDIRSQNVWLPLIGGLVVLLPAFFLEGRREKAALPSQQSPAPAIELSCGPFVDSFAAMRAEADRIAMMASSAAIPLEEDAPATAPTIEMWREIAGAAGALDRWVWEAQSQEAPLTQTEAAVLAESTRLTSEMRAGSLAVVGDLVAPGSEMDAALVVRRMDGLARTASRMARELEPLAICDAPEQRTEVTTYAPALPPCETRDPHFQYAMEGPCR